jgi:hypothetical protein
MADMDLYLGLLGPGKSTLWDQVILFQVVEDYIGGNPMCELVRMRIGVRCHSQASPIEAFVVGQQIYCTDTESLEAFDDSRMGVTVAVSVVELRVEDGEDDDEQWDLSLASDALEGLEGLSALCDPGTIPMKTTVVRCQLAAKPDVLEAVPDASKQSALAMKPASRG